MDQTDQLAKIFVRKNVAYRYYVVKTSRHSKAADAILLREIQCKKTDILMFKQRFQRVFD